MLRTGAATIDAIVKFVYRCNRIHIDQPFWQRRHAFLADEPLPLELIHTIGSQPWGPYFREAIEGMGVDEELLALANGTVSVEQVQAQLVA